ncbi:MAG: hypothetical protein LBN95_06245 [Prevotellaceae bacterium]|jgi:hypothetical protein|nr:hypothetical protein [Prevotellaceae bacterium]
MGLFKKKAGNQQISESEVAAIAMQMLSNNDMAAIAMALMSGNGDMAAVAAALALYSDDCHDHESGVITLKRIGCTEWNSKSTKLLGSAYRR